MGMYDTIHFRCPNCTELNFYQSKLGECSLQEFTINEAPLLIIADLHDEAAKDRLYCEHCGNKIHIKVKFAVSISCDSEENGTFRTV